MEIRVLGLLLGAAFTLFPLAAPATAQVFINETFSNPPGTDNGAEFFELRSTTPNLSLSGLLFLIIEGDGLNAGVIDQALDLSAFSTGSNGLFLWRDSTTVLQPPPSPGTFVHVADFAPDIENGAQTFLIVRSFTGLLGDDLDTDNDGVLDALPWNSVVDAIGVLEAGIPGLVYGASLGFSDFPGTLLFTPDLLFRVSGSNAWVGADVLGSNPGPFGLDANELVDIFGNPLNIGDFDITTATPGSANPVPEPSLIALVAVGMTGAVYRQWRRRRSCRT